jgi:hypothetical protein
MTKTIIEELASIRDDLDQKREFVCAAHIQMAIDTLSARTQRQR